MKGRDNVTLEIYVKNVYRTGTKYSGKEDVVSITGTFEYKNEPEMFDMGKDEDVDTNRKKETGVLTRRRKSRSPYNKGGRMNYDKNLYIGRLLTICPCEKLEFFLKDGAKVAHNYIVLKNTLPYSIAYKVKTTSPEKYKVRPVYGYVRPGSSVDIFIYLQNGYQNTGKKDKFLIMAMEVTDESDMPLADLWKNVQKESIMEHRLRCVVYNSNKVKDIGSGKLESRKIMNKAELSKEVETLYEMNQGLKRSVNLLLCFLGFILSLFLGLLCLVLYTYLYGDRLFSIWNLMGT